MKKDIVGQEQLTKDLDRIFNIFQTSAGEVRPHFIITGESGSSKTFIIQNIAEEYNLGFLEINAAQLTKEGTSGNSLSKAMSPLITMGLRPCIVFVDEFDKLFISGNSNNSAAHESTTGVQNEFLKVLESDTASVFGDYGKYINVSIKNALFVFAGAFNGEVIFDIDRLREIGIKTEFLGRVGLVYNTKKLTLDNMYEIIDRSVLLEKYLSLFESVDKEKTLYDLKGHICANYEQNTLGARIINTMIHQYFIRGGKLNDAEVKSITFQKKLTL